MSITSDAGTPNPSRGLAPTAPAALADAATLPDLKAAGALALNVELSERLGTEVRTYDARWATYAQEGVLVEVHLARERFKLQLTLQDLGIEPSSKQEADQLNSIMALGHRYLLPRAIAVKRPEAIESEARETLKRYSWKTYWGRWVHVQTFPLWLAANAAVQAKYLALVEEIEANYDQLCAEATVAWVGVCQRAYDQLARTTAAARIPNFGDRDAWIAAQVADFRGRIPTRERIRAKFSYQWDVYSLPSLVQQVRDESQEARWQRMSDAERAMQVSLEATARRRLQGGVDQFLAEIRGQIQAEVLKVSSAALKVVQRRAGKLERNSSTALKDLIEQWRAMVFWDDDQTIASRLADLERILETDPKQRDPEATTRALRTLSAEARLALLSLEVAPERTAIGEVALRNAFAAADAVGIVGDTETLEGLTRRAAPVDADEEDDTLYEDEDEDGPVVVRAGTSQADTLDDDDGLYEDDAVTLARQAGAVALAR